VLIAQAHAIAEFVQACFAGSSCLVTPFPDGELDLEVSYKSRRWLLSIAGGTFIVDELQDGEIAVGGGFCEKNIGRAAARLESLLLAVR
jgi:hypothetical protein